MPIFIFKCHKCGEEFEDFRALKDEPEKGKCLKCGSSDITRYEQVFTECGCGCGCGEAGKLRE